MKPPIWTLHAKERFTERFPELDPEEVDTYWENFEEVEHYGKQRKRRILRLGPVEYLSQRFFCWLQHRCMLVVKDDPATVVTCYWIDDEERSWMKPKKGTK